MSDLSPPSGATEWNHYGTQWVAERPQQLWRRHSDAVNIRLIEEWLPSRSLECVLKTDLFDEAVSEGVCRAIAARSQFVVGLDVSMAVLMSAQKNSDRLTATGADVRRLPFNNSSFDAVVSLSTLDHFESVEDIPLAISELFRVLRPGGVLILTLDNPGNPIVSLRNALPYKATHAAGLVPYPVGRTAGHAAAGQMAVNAGFVVTDRTAIMHAPRVIAVPMMNLLARNGDSPTGRAFLRAAMSFEKFRELPTRFLTGHFIAIRATKPAIEELSTASENRNFHD